MGKEREEVLGVPFHCPPAFVYQYRCTNVCVWGEREREKESVSVCVCVYVSEFRPRPDSKWVSEKGRSVRVREPNQRRTVQLFSDLSRLKSSSQFLFKIFSFVIQTFKSHLKRKTKTL